ncbi:MAG: hypothetical protein ACOCSQ_03800 [Planctomycetota bacterium]
MRGERPKDRSALMNKYGLDARLAARVVALLTKKIDLTPTVLEAAATDGSLRQLLLDRELLTHPEKLSDEWLHRHATHHRVGDADLLRAVSDNGEWTTIALEDDVLAEKAEDTKQTGGSEVANGMDGVVRAEETDISRRETEELFTPEEVAQLKLTALTSQDSGEQVEALRKLIYAPMDAGSKARLFVRALIDPGTKSEVRRQAVQSLEEIGFREELARTIHRLFRAEDEDMLYAIRRLGAMWDEADESERSVALAVVLRVFDECDRPPILKELLGVIARSNAVLTQHERKTEQFVQAGLRQLTQFYDQLSDTLFDVFQKYCTAAPDLVVPVLWKELQRSGDARVRAFIVHLLSHTTPGEDEEEREKLADAAIEELLNTELPEDHRTQLRYGLLRLGAATARAANRRLSSNSGRRNAELIRVLDVVCTESESPAEMINETVQAFLDALQIADRITRRRIVESSVISDGRVKTDLQEQVAEELLVHLGEFAMESTRDTICHTLEQIGPAAVSPLHEYIQRNYPHQDTSGPLRSLGRIAQKWQGQLSSDQVKEVLDFCLGLLDDPRASRGTFTVTLAFFVGYTDRGASQFRNVMDRFMELAGTAGFTFDVFEAMGILAGSPHITPEYQRELFRLFRDVLHMETPNTRGVKRDTDEGPVYEFGPEVLFDTRLLPNVVSGLEQIGVSPVTPDELRREVVKEMLILWEGVSHVRIVWGPAAMGSLIQAISRVARCDHVSSEVRARLGLSILRFLNKINVVRSLGQICSRPVEDDRMRDLCIETGHRMLEEWESCDEQDYERRIALLTSLGRVAANEGLDSSEKDVDNLRENVMEALFRALREGVDEVQSSLERLRDCAALTGEQRDKIRDRLSRVYGLVQKNGE